MKLNMKEWKASYLAKPKKKPIPILSFPGIQIIGHTVEELTKSGELQAQCMKAIADRFDTGVSFSLMDLSVEAEAFGSKVVFSPDDVPTIVDALVKDEEAAEALRIPEIGAGRTGECVNGIKKACELITDRPVFAGMIGPYSLAGRLLDMTEIMILCYEDPDMVETVLEKATQFLITYAKAFKAAGANGIAMAEPAAGILSPRLMEKFSNPYVKRIIEAVEDEYFTVLYHNCGNIEFLLKNVNGIDAEIYSVGNAIEMEKAMETFSQDKLILGNIDPAGIIRNGTPESVKEETIKLMKKCGKYHNFVLSSGCDIPPMSPLENIQAFFDAAKEYYEELK